MSNIDEIREQAATAGLRRLLEPDGVTARVVLPDIRKAAQSVWLAREWRAVLSMKGAKE
jgi:hypothetical protein